jgi:UDPglucose 6-dehydrogenase
MNQLEQLKQHTTVVADTGDFEAMKALMRKPFILDGRNLYNPDALSELGVAYQGVGRRNDLAQLMDFGLPTGAPTADELMNA